MRVYVRNTAKKLIVTLADDTDVDATGVDVTLTGFERTYDGPERWAARAISDKVYVPAAGDTPGYTVLTMPFTEADVAEPGWLRIQIDADWPGGPQTVRPLQGVRIRA